MLQAAHIIALGMTTLDVLAEAKTAEMSQSMRLRYRGCANGLNRATLQTEKALDQRLGDEIPAAAPTPVADPADNIVSDIADAELDAAIQEAIVAHRNNSPYPAASATHATPVTAATQQDQASQLWAAAMLDSLHKLGVPVQPAPNGSVQPAPNA
jgi:hypothetical protein